MSPLARLAVLVLPLAGLAGGWGWTHVRAQQGTEWDVPVSATGPRASLRGRYLAFRYDWGLAPGAAIEGAQALCLEGAPPRPERVRIVMPVATGLKTTVLTRLTLFEQVMAIENDPHFHGGDYYDGPTPAYGLALARMISHKTFVHLDTIEKRAGANVSQPDGQLSWYKVGHNVESYMLYQGKKFVSRFDANSYLRIINMWLRFDPLRDAGVDNYEQLFARSTAAGHHYLVFSIDSDFCFYPEEQAELTASLEKARTSCMHITVHSAKGHDSFLLEPELYTPHLVYTLEGRAHRDSVDGEVAEVE